MELRHTCKYVYVSRYMCFFPCRVQRLGMLGLSMVQEGKPCSGLGHARGLECWEAWLPIRGCIKRFRATCTEYTITVVQVSDEELPGGYAYRKFI